MSIFSQVPVTKRPSSWFDLSHDNLLSTGFGKLVPVLVEEILPGDKWRITPQMYSRFMPLLAPVFGKVDSRLDFFYIPNRLIDSHFEDFITKSLTGDADVTPPLHCTFYDIETYAQPKDSQGKKIWQGTLSDYMGIPWYNRIINDIDPDFDGSMNDPTPIKLQPFAAYQLVWNEYYRDQNLDVDLTDLLDKFKSSSGPLSIGNQLSEKEFKELLLLRNRRLEKDYFTSALPFTQRGVDITIPFAGSNAPVVVDHLPDNMSGFIEGTTNGGLRLERRITNQVLAFLQPYAESGNQATHILSDEIGTSGVNRNVLGVTSNFAQSGSREAVTYNAFTSSDSHQISLLGTADLSGVSAATINDLRTAFALQQFLEQSARGGGRYKETLFLQFGVWTKDSRIDRPEYLGGSRQYVQVTEQLQLSTSTDSATPQGNPSGTMASAGVGQTISRSFDEHGWIIGLLSFRVRTSYKQGLRKFWSKIDAFDYGWPQFGNLGEQAIKMSEIYFGSTKLENGEVVSASDDTFGYTPRYAEYKMIPSSVHGSLQGDMSFWTLTRTMIEQPQLNSDFVSAVDNDNNRYSRIFPVESLQADPILVELFFKIKARRKLPRFGVPHLNA